MKKLLSNLSQLFFPKTCLACKNILTDDEQSICHHCLSELPYTHFLIGTNNLMYQKLSPYINIEGAYSLVYFRKRGNIQEILHQLKYKNHQEIGELFGKIMAERINENKEYPQFDFIIPIPLHPKKYKKRGYNQLTFLCKTLADKLNCSCEENLLIKVKHNKSQTHKNMQERKENVQGIFQLKQPEKFSGKHFLLIDDVMTTGATLESAAKELLKINEAKLSIATLAMVE